MHMLHKRCKHSRSFFGVQLFLIDSSFTNKKRIKNSLAFFLYVCRAAVSERIQDGLMMEGVKTSKQAHLLKTTICFLLPFKEKDGKPQTGLRFPAVLCFPDG